MISRTRFFEVSRLVLNDNGVLGRVNKSFSHQHRIRICRTLSFNCLINNNQAAKKFVEPAQKCALFGSFCRILKSEKNLYFVSLQLCWAKNNAALLTSTLGNSNKTLCKCVNTGCQTMNGAFEKGVSVTQGHLNLYNDDSYVLLKEKRFAESYVIWVAHDKGAFFSCRDFSLIRRKLNDLNVPAGYLASRSVRHDEISEDNADIVWHRQRE